jgi:hypothetical protein
VAENQTLADLLRQKAQAAIDFPTTVTRNLFDPQAFLKQIGYTPNQQLSGFSAGYAGVPEQPPSDIGVLDPKNIQYNKGYGSGEDAALATGILSGTAALTKPIAKPVGRALGEYAWNKTEKMMQQQGLMPNIVPVGPNRIPSNEILFPNRTLDSLNSAEKSALTKFDKELKNPAVMRREILRSHFNQLMPQEQRITPLVNKQILTPEDLLDTQILGFGGDQSKAGVKMNAVNGVPLSKDVIWQGGDEFAFLKPNYKNNTVWSSNYGPAGGHLENIDKTFVASEGRPVRALKVGMNPEGVNFSHPVAQALVRQLDTLQPYKKDIAFADEMIRNQANAKGKRGDYVNFAGLNSPNLEEQLLMGTPEASGGDLRKAIANSMASYELKKRGFPVYEDVLDAGLIPELRHKRTGEAGNLIYEPNYQDVLTQTGVYPHGSYTHEINRKAGGVIGGFKETIPIDVLAHKTFDAKIAEGKTRAQALRSMQTSHWSEHFDQESVDKAMKYLEEQTKK